MILSVKEAIKPGFCSVYFKSFSQEMIKAYLNQFKELNFDAEDPEQQLKILKS